MRCSLRGQMIGLDHTMCGIERQLSPGGMRDGRQHRGNSAERGARVGRWVEGYGGLVW